MIKTYQPVSLKPLLALLRPLVRFWLKNSRSYQDFIKLAKLAFIEVAEEEIRKTGKKVNISRLSVFTGLDRGDVTRIYRERPEPTEEPLGILARILGQWRQNRRFASASGDPRLLDYTGDDSEFKHLVESVTKTINPGTVLSELDRLRFVEKTPKGVRLLREVFTMQSDRGSGVEVLSRDIETLFGTVEENLFGQPEISNLHIRTEYDNVVSSRLPEIRRWLVKEGKKFHKKTRNFISKFDKDIASLGDKTPGGGRVTVTAFSLTSAPQEETEKKALKKTK